ncbi:energy transducer TonB [Luteimonas vadosa]|uniref:TonB C-terminal domain-containing protein n=1 Tax=Luteimonas vadosa TaxID=1165507 RepID=A0ABP9E249_9GAMM
MPSSASRPWFRLSAGAAWSILAAAGLGLLLFLALWVDQRNDRDFYRQAEAPRRADGQAFEPLPAPPAISGSIDTRLPDADRNAGRGQPPDILPPLPPPVAPPPAEQPPPLRAEATGFTSPPVPIDMPPPSYPPEAMRRRESGTVLLRIEVDAQGRPHSMDIVRASGSRHLDRAALVAARSWRFRPAMRNGEPVSGTVNVPVSFDARR